MSEAIGKEGKGLAYHNGKALGEMHRQGAEENKRKLNERR